MCWLERGLVRAFLVLFVPLALAGCQVRPLYSTGASGSAPQADLPAISVQAPGSRMGQVYRNALLYGLRGGGEGAETRYSLSYRLTTHSQGIAVERGTGTPNAYQITGSASFLLKNITTDQSLFGTNVTAVDTYTRSSQSFANIRAKRDAEDRLAQALAQLTEARLTAYFATN